MHYHFTELATPFYQIELVPVSTEEWLFLYTFNGEDGAHKEKLEHYYQQSVTRHLGKNAFLLSLRPADNFPFCSVGKVKVEI
ncbi:hypothetical protein [Hufsiella ginkgonis]|uniref:Uncharacterized protein n=1 Tax=Hufsiella ginkgonis TaxID=2695274 RepID=A0A7K1Y0X5_9SPHI|nr:hypothetical protein [Hufsiella ginkgonis]MXV16738.1 hypothetical protein [Hufsiella ginkgonis]